MAGWQAGRQADFFKNFGGYKWKDGSREGWMAFQVFFFFFAGFSYEFMTFTAKNDE